jgi:hypothetical protein
MSSLQSIRYTDVIAGWYRDELEINPFQNAVNQVIYSVLCFRWIPGLMKLGNHLKQISITL